MGSRLSKVSNGTPKILVNVFEKPLIDQLLSNCIDSGINDVVIVTGFNDHIIKEYLSRIKTPVTIEIAYNPEWNLANGVSVLAAKKFIPKNEDFLISMSDHYYNNLILTMMKNHTNENTIASVGADYKIDDIHDIQKQIGYLPELNPLYTEMRVYEYLEFLAGIRKITGKQFKEAFARVVEQCGLKNTYITRHGYKLCGACFELTQGLY